MSSPPTDRRWKKPLPPFVFNRDFDRPAPADVAVLARADVTRVSDLVGRMYTCQPHLRSLVSPARPICGPAFTVKCPPGDNLGVMAAVRAVGPGDVLVVDGQGFTHWCMGGFELLKYACEQRGMAGLVVHGAWRDVQEAQAAGLPVYALAAAPHSGPKFGPAELNVPVACAGVIVHPGDVVCASAEGVAVAPRGSVAALAQALRAGASNGHGIENFLQEMDEHVAAWLAGGGQ